MVEDTISLSLVNEIVGESGTGGDGEGCLFAAVAVGALAMLVVVLGVLLL